MIRFCFTFNLLSAVFISAHCGNVVSLVITHADGTTTSYQLFTKPRVTFIGDSVKITTPTVSAEYSAKDVIRFNYKLPATAIDNTAADNQLKSDGEYLIFGGNVKADNVKLFTSDGIEVATKFTTASGNLRLRLSSLQKGVYLININGRTSKFMKR
jgi:hypothetical protein